MKDQINYYTKKLQYEIDSWDLSLLLKEKNQVVVFDVRSKEAYEAEHILGALHFPHREMTVESTKDLNKEMLYVSYCDGIGCNGSTKGAINLAKLGFKVKELIGGLDWWKRDKHPTEGKKESVSKEVVCGC